MIFEDLAGRNLLLLSFEHLFGYLSASNAEISNNMWNLLAAFFVKNISQKHSLLINLSLLAVTIFPILISNPKSEAMNVFWAHSMGLFTRRHKNNNGFWVRNGRVGRPFPKEIKTKKEVAAGGGREKDHPKRWEKLFAQKKNKINTNINEGGKWKMVPPK